MQALVPKISIITPSFNQGEFIEDAILSVIAQNYDNYEHIVIDNCSTDSTLEVISRYPHVTVISEPDEGQADALRKGFSMASSDIIGWLNADDCYLPGTFKIVSAELSSEKVDAVYANYRFVNQDGEYMRDIILHRPIKWFSLFHCFIPSTTFFFKRNIIDSGVNVKKEYHITMDKEFFAHILHAGYSIKYLNKCFADFRWHGGNKSIDTPKVKRIRYKEGLSIFNAYSSLHFPESDFWTSMYGIVANMLRVYRRYLILTEKRK